MDLQSGSSKTLPNGPTSVSATAAAGRAAAIGMAAVAVVAMSGLTALPGAQPVSRAIKAGIAEIAAAIGRRQAAVAQGLAI